MRAGGWVVDVDVQGRMGRKVAAGREVDVDVRGRVTGGGMAV